MTPRWPLIFMSLLTVVPMSLGPLYPVAGTVGLWLSLGLLAVAFVDLAISQSPRRVEVYREVGDVLSVGTRNAVKLFFRNRGSQELFVEVHDEPPLPCDIDGLPRWLTLSPNKIVHRTYHVTPHQRGQNRFGQIMVRCHTRLALWSLLDRRNLPKEVKIYPDIQAVQGVELLARLNRLAEAGVRLSRLRGRGNEFDRLREYRREDEYRSIDWKATARRQQLVSREYVVERNQNILILLDCGRSMCNESSGIRHFDRSLNAALLLSYVALRQGDTVGLLACSHKMHRRVKPVRGATGIQRLIRETYDLEPTFEASDYELMVEQIRTWYRKRSLVIIVTHALDEVHQQHITDTMQQLRRPHLVLGAFLANVELRERLATFPDSAQEAFQVAAAAEMVHNQSRQIGMIQKQGLLALDCEPAELSATLVSKYLDIKARHLL